MKEYLSTIRRLLWVSRILAKHGFATAIDWLGGKTFMARVLRRPAASGPERFRTMLEDLGGTFIKFGQMLALQPDILPLEYCNALFRLLDRVAPFGIDEVNRIFREETGRIPADIFDTFRPDPIATASIGQVHIGTIGRRRYAVKVQRPRVPAEFGGDIRMMVVAIGIIRTLRIRPLFWMVEPMSEFVHWTREELDYRFEARYMEQHRRNAAGNACERIPEVLWEYTTTRTLVVEFFDGPTLLSCMRALETDDRAVLDRLDEIGFDSHVVAANIIDNFLGDVFQHGMFHADLHPANLIVLPGNVIGYIDFGITGVISMYSRQNLIALTLAYTTGDLNGMCEAFFKVSSTGPDSDIPGFREGLRRAGETWYEMDGGRRRLRKNFTLVMLDMLRLSRQTGIWPERDVIKYIRSAIAIDGLITRFAPSFDLSGHLSTVCDRYLRWHVRSGLFTFENFMNWVRASNTIATEGPSLLLKSLTDRNRRKRSQPEQSATSGASSRHKLLYLSAFAFTVCIAASPAATTVEPGLNVFTAEAALATCAFLLMGSTLRKLRREE